MATQEHSPTTTTPALPIRALAGLLAAGAAVGVATGAAALIAPGAGPFLVLGGAMIDAAPSPLKEFAVRTFGNADKPILLGSIAVVLALLAAILGVIGWRHRRIAIGGVVLLGVVAAAVSLTRPGASALSVVPSLIAALVGGLIMAFVTRPPNPTPSRVDRRRVLVGLTGSAVLAALGSGTALVVDAVRDANAAARRALGLPAPASTAPPIPDGVQVPGNTPFQTATEDFYRVDISLTTPQISTDGWELIIDGLVDNPVTLSYEDLLAMPLIERDITLTCVSNEVGGQYVSTGRWLGVPLADLVALVKPQGDVDQLFTYSLDSGYTCSTPYQAVTDTENAMIAVGLNGAPLPAANGYPARMIVPGLFGFVSGTKWLSRMEFTTYAERTAYWTERDWVTDAPILTQSRIDVPQSLSTIPADKAVIAGVAWAQQRGIKKVEVQVDDGPWQEAKLAADGGINLWRQWWLEYKGPTGQHRARVRATDLDGYTQTDKRTKVFPRGATGQHQIIFTTE